MGNRIKIRDVTSQDEGGSPLIFETDDGRKFDLQNDEEREKLEKALRDQRGR